MVKASENIERVNLANRRAGCSVLILTLCYVLHWVGVFSIAPENKLTTGNIAAGIVIATLVTIAFAWSGVAVWRGGRLLGPGLVAGLCLFGGAISAVLSVKLPNKIYPLFTILQVVIVIWAIVTTVSLMAAHYAREQRT